MNYKIQKTVCVPLMHVPSWKDLPKNQEAQAVYQQEPLL